MFLDFSPKWRTVRCTHFLGVCLPCSLPLILRKGFFSFFLSTCGLSQPSTYPKLGWHPLFPLLLISLLSFPPLGHYTMSTQGLKTNHPPQKTSQSPVAILRYVLSSSPAFLKASSSLHHPPLRESTDCPALFLCSLSSLGLGYSLS